MNATTELADVKGQEAAKRALEVAAAGGHPILLVGPPGTGKAMLARRLPDLMPPMSAEESAEVAEIYGCSGGLEMPPVRPFRSPHPGASTAGMTGGGRLPRPGEVTLAHGGVLFLEELPEFRRDVLETIRQPLDEGKITIVRARTRVEFPARFHLVAAMSRCPCGGWGDPQRSCRCSEELRSRYLRRVQSVLDRIEITVEVPSLLARELRERPGESTETVARRVAAARRIQVDRSGALNAAMGPADVERHCLMDGNARKLLDRAAERFDLDQDAVTRIRKVARTIADLDQRATFQAAHVGEAIQYRSLKPSNR